jgi:hypothetical protein
MWHDATLFVYLIFSSTHSQSITFIQYIYPLPLDEVSLHLLIAGSCPLYVPSRESHSGLPDSGADAPFSELRRTLKRIFTYVLTQPAYAAKFLCVACLRVCTMYIRYARYCHI